MKDPLIAAQIAYFNNKPYHAYLIRGFDVGLKIEHLADIKIFAPVYQQLISDKKLLAEYKTRRKAYIGSIDFSYRVQLTKEFIQDQKDKQQKNYYELKYYMMQRLLNSIDSKGFPGAKLIGIDDKKMFSEIGKPEFDADNLFRKLGPELKYLKVDEEILSTKFIMYVLFHNQCSYRYLEGSADRLISKGEIHPREIAILYDNLVLNSRDKVNCKRVAESDGVFRVDRYQYTGSVDSKVPSDSLRKRYHISPRALDLAKIKFEEQHGFKLAFGFWGCM